MKEKTKIEASFIEAIVEAGIEAVKNLLNVETDENGKLKSFKLIKEGNKGTVYEFEVRVHTESNAEEEDSDRRTSKGKDDKEKESKNKDDKEKEAKGKDDKEKESRGKESKAKEKK